MNYLSVCVFLNLSLKVFLRSLVFDKKNVGVFRSWNRSRNWNWNWNQKIKILGVGVGIGVGIGVKKVDSPGP